MLKQHFNDTFIVFFIFNQPALYFPQFDIMLYALLKHLISLIWPICEDASLSIERITLPLFDDSLILLNIFVSGLYKAFMDVIVMLVTSIV